MNMNKNLVIGLAVVVVLIGGFLAYSLSRQPQVAPSITTTQTQASPSSSIPRPTSKPGTQAVITSVALSTAIGANGAPINPTTTFSSKTPAIYAVLTLKNAVQRTQLSYVRYYEDKYVDAKVSHPTKDGILYFNFAFLLNAGQTRKAGHYMLNFYVNGAKAQSISYVVR